MTRGCRQLGWVLAVLLGASLASDAFGTTDHLLFPDTHVPGGLTVAFVGDGFKTSDELKIYGSVVQTLYKGLIKRDVYDVHSGRFNFYRIDVVDPMGVTGNACSAAALNKTTAVPAYIDPEAPSVVATHDKDLLVEQCWGGGNEDVLYTDKPELALDLAGQIPDLKVVVIVANARLVAGGAQLLPTPQQTTIAVVGAHVSAIGPGGTWMIDDYAVTALAHELAHGLGLLDEYTSLKTGQVPPFEECRNVWKPDASPQSSGTPTWAATVKPIPWHGVLTRYCSTENMVRCQAKKNADNHCVLEDLEPAEAYCSYVPRTGNPNVDGCPVPPECNVFPGAWEGAHYDPEHYYRATDNCRMLSTGVNHQFCPACRQYLDLYLEHFGEDPSTGPWPSARCLSAGGELSVPEAPDDVSRVDVN